MKNLCLTVLLFGASAHADILQVPTQYKTIQLAIDSATTGDAVHISSGTYYEKIDLLGKAIQVIGIDGPDVTTVDASGLNGSVVTCMQNEGPNTIIAGLTLTGGTGTVHPVWKTLQGGGGHSVLGKSNDSELHYFGESGRVCRWDVGTRIHWFNSKCNF